MKHIALAIVVIVTSSPSAFAQTEGRIAVGGAFAINATTDDEVGTWKGVGFLVRLNPRRGWGPAGAFNWFRADLADPSGAPGDFARIRIRPLMGGVSYTVGRGSLLTSFSIVGGPSFNSVRFDEDYSRTGAAAIDADTSLAIRPGVGLTYTVRPRVALVGFGGFLVNRPGIVYRDSAGNEFRDRWKADGVVLSVGAVYSFF